MRTVKPKVLEDMIGQLVGEGDGLISIYYGKEYSAENAERLAKEITQLYPDCDVELEYGGQPVYYCIISVE